MVGRKKSFVKPALMLLALFVLGGVTGVFGTLAFVHDREARALRQGPKGFEERRLNGMARRLDLDDAQREQVRALMDQNHEASRALGKKMMDECGAPLQAQRDAFEAGMRKVLRPDQVTRYEQLQKERHGPGDLGPPPPFP